MKGFPVLKTKLTGTVFVLLYCNKPGCFNDLVATVKNAFTAVFRFVIGYSIFAFAEINSFICLLWIATAEQHGQEQEFQVHC